MKAYKFRSPAPDGVDRALDFIERIPSKVIGGVVVAFVLMLIWGGLK